MKKSIIQAIYYGENGIDQIKMTEEEKKYFSLFSDSYDQLLHSLTPQQIKLQQKMTDERERAFAEELEHCYCEGFKRGLLLGIECTDDE